MIGSTDQQLGELFSRLRRTKGGSITLALMLLLIGVVPHLQAKNLPKLPKYMFSESHRAHMKHWVDSVYQTLSLEEQVAQLIMPIVYPSSDVQKLSSEEERVRRNQWGGILYQRGVMPDQLKMNQRLQSISRVPMLIALDGEWGLYMRLKDAPRYPRNMGLGLRGDEQMLYNYGREVARQCRLMGIHINFAPDVDVNVNPHNPVIGTRSFGDDPRRVTASSLAYASGLEDGDVLSVAKHFPGHGDTNEDSHHTLPTVSVSKKRMKEVELLPFVKYINYGLGGVMTAHLRVPAYEPTNLPSSLSQKITTELLKEQLGFNGLVFTDGLEMKGVTGGNAKEIGVLALLAGNDILLGPTNPEAMLTQVVSAVRSGRISPELIREKVIKVLCYKWRLIIVPKHRVASPSSISADVWTQETIVQQRQLWQASLHYVRSDSSVLRALGSRDYMRIAVVQIGKNPAPLPSRPRSTGRKGSKIDYYTWEEYTADPQTLASYDLQLLQIFSPNYVSLTRLEAISARKPTILAYMTSPYKVAQGGKLHLRPKIVLIAFEAAREAQQAVLNLLTSESKQSISIDSNSGADDTLDPTANMGFPKGSVEQETHRTNEASLRQLISSSSLTNMTNTASPFQAIDALATEGIRRGAYPGCQIYISHKGRVIYNKSFGTLTGGIGATAVTNAHIYDVASITKALATTPILMHLVGQKKIQLSAPLKTYLSEFSESPLGAIRIEELLWHQAGLPAGYHFFRDLIDPQSYEGNLIRYRYFPEGIKLVGQAWGNPNFTWLPEYISTKPSDEHSLLFADGLYITPTFRDLMLQRIAAIPLKKRGTYRYSDLSFILLQEIAERVSGLTLDEYLNTYITQPIGAQVFYNPLKHNIPKDLIAPTQRDKFLRKQEIRGTVDDETAACLGGVAGNAGLYANATELGKICQLILQRGRWHNKTIIPYHTVDLFISSTSMDGRRALGFDKPKPGTTHNTAAESASPGTIGHMGFTGTVFWIDPLHELVFIFLSNRTYPTRENNLLIKDRYRPRLHQLAYDAIR